MDMIEQLGGLALASRLKRLAERLGRDVSRVYDEHEIEFHARWFPLMYLLRDTPRLAVTEIAEKLGMTHPSVNQIAGQMTRHGLLKISGDASDGRRRLLSLSPKGRTIVKRLQPVWETIRKANEDLLAEAGGGFLKQLRSLEQALDRREMYDRVTDLVNPGAKQKTNQGIGNKRRKR
jgi:DNA-binding MarR family transcriptional regulator